MRNKEIISDKEEQALFTYYAKLVGVYKKKSRTKQYPIKNLSDFSSEEELRQAYSKLVELESKMLSFSDLLYPEDYWDREYVVKTIRVAIERMICQIKTVRFVNEQNLIYAC